MHPLLGRFGPFFLYTYQYVWGLGILGGLALAYALTPRPRRAADWFDPLLLGLMAGIFGGRVATVAVHWDYYRVTPGEIWLVWRGGLSYHGALLAALAGMWLWDRWRGGNWMWNAGILPLLLPLLHLTGWFACYWQGCGYGKLALPGLLAADLPDNYGVFDLRYQTQLLGMGLSLLVLLLSIYARRRKMPPRNSFWLTLLLLAGTNLLLWPWRGDQITIVGFWVDAALVIGSLLALLLGGNAGSKQS